MVEQIEIWNYRNNFNYDLPLEPGDDFLVDLQKARGEFSKAPILRQLGMDTRTNELKNDQISSQYILFGGHRGCGKSTVLRELNNDLSDSKGYFVVFVDAVKQLDVNNLRYCDIALVEAQALVEKLHDEGVSVPGVYSDRLQKWFDERVEKVERAKNIAGEIKAGAEVKSGLPLIGRLFASLTTAISTNSSYKEEIRREIKDAFSEFAEAFNQLLVFAVEKLKDAGLGRSIVFLVDGTDRLSGDDSRAFFLEDIHQLRLIKSNFIYCAPIHILIEHGQINHNFDATFRLPMVKLSEKGQVQRIDVAWEKLRELVIKRLPLDFFDDVSTLDLLIGASGGHPRDLLRLIILCFQEIDAAPITSAVAKKSIKRLANEYRRLITSGDYKLLYGIDTGDKNTTPINQHTRRMLYDLVLLEYNDFWWQSHPVVRELDGYKQLIPAS